MKKIDFLGPAFRKKLKDAMKHLDESIDVLYEVATRDEKTGLYNHKFFKTVFNLELESASRGRKLSLVIVDIDFFKKVNDKYGHLTGDEILAGLAKLLQKIVRKNDVVARFGGEEFFIMLPNTSINTAKKVAERLRKAVEKKRFKPKITISLGVSEYKKGDNLNKITKRADKALYVAKEGGRNKVVVG